MKKNRRLFGILFLICYLVTLSQIRLFCRVGMIRSRLPLLLLGTVGAVVCFVLWLLSEKPGEIFCSGWNGRCLWEERCTLERELCILQFPITGRLPGR